MKMNCPPNVCAYLHGGPNEGGWWWVKTHDGSPPYMLEVPVHRGPAIANLIQAEDSLPDPETAPFDIHLYSLDSAVGSEAEYVYEGVK